MKHFLFSILTPRECVYEGEIDSLVLPTTDGAIGFLSCREDTVIEVMGGDLHFRDKEGAEYRIETDGGVFQMNKSGGVLLVGAAYFKGEAAEKRKERAEALEEEKKRQEQSLADYKMTRAALMRAFEKIKRANGQN